MLSLGQETRFDLTAVEYLPPALRLVWIMARCELPVLRKFVLWVQAQVGDPFAGIDQLLALYQRVLPPDEYRTKALETIKAAEDRTKALQCMDLNSPLIGQYMGSVPGAMKLLHLMLEVNHPGVTEDEAAQIFNAVGMAKATQAIGDANGRLPEKNAPAPAAILLPAG